MKRSVQAASALPLSETRSTDQLLDDVIVQTAQAPARADGIAIGTFDGIAADGTALVSIAAFGLHRIAARSISAMASEQIGQTIALGFESSNPMKPIILGLMLSSPAAPAPRSAVAVVDGETVTLRAEHEIELRCGDAAIVLSADGRIELRGTYITSHASATQRILGGSVNIN